MSDTTFASHYSSDSFWEKVKKTCAKAGSKVVYTALLLFYALQEPTVPIKAKTTITGALGYFIFPFDAIPDVAPVVGFADDLGVLILALVAVSMHINDNVKAKARSKLKDLFGNAIDWDELSDIDKKLNA